MVKNRRMETISMRIRRPENVDEIRAEGEALLLTTMANIFGPFCEQIGAVRVDPGKSTSLVGLFPIAAKCINGDEYNVRLTQSDVKFIVIRARRDCAVKARHGFRAVSITKNSKHLSLTLILQFSAETQKHIITELRYNDQIDAKNNFKVIYEEDC